MEDQEEVALVLLDTEKVGLEDLGMVIMVVQKPDTVYLDTEMEAEEADMGNDAQIHFFIY